MKVFLVPEPKMSDENTPWVFGGVYSTLELAVAAVKNCWNGWIAWVGPFPDEDVGDTYVIFGFEEDEHEIVKPTRFVITEFEIDKAFDH